MSHLGYRFLQSWNFHRENWILDMTGFRFPQFWNSNLGYRILNLGSWILHIGSRLLQFWFLAAGTHSWPYVLDSLLVDRSFNMVLQSKASAPAGTHSLSYSHHNSTVDRSFNAILQQACAAGHIPIISWQPINVLLRLYNQSDHASWHAQLVAFTLAFDSRSTRYYIFLHLVRTAKHIRVIFW